MTVHVGSSPKVTIHQAPRVRYVTKYQPLPYVPVRVFAVMAGEAAAIAALLWFGSPV